MALSNWDTLTVNHRGESVEGSFIFSGGVWVESYKNWLYVHDPSGWTEEPRGFVHDTVMQVDEGEISYKGIHIKAIRGPQNGIYFAAWHGYGEEAQGMVGIGCYGFRGELEYVLEKYPHLKDSLDPRYLDPDQYMIANYSERRKGEVRGWGFEFWARDGESQTFKWDLSDLEPPSLDELWVGAAPKSVEQLQGLLREWAEEGAVPKELVAQVDLNKALRFNQGDAFFAEAGVAPLEGTPVGEAEEPILTQALRAKKGNDNESKGR